MNRQPPHSQKETYDLHRAGVKAVMRSIQKDGFHVERADSTGFVPPGRVEVDRPDVIARRIDRSGHDELYAFGVVRFADDIDTDRSRAQLLELGSRVMKDTQDLCPLYVATPAEDVEPVRAFLRAIGLGVMPNVKVIAFTAGGPAGPR